MNLDFIVINLTINDVTHAALVRCYSLIITHTFLVKVSRSIGDAYLKRPEFSFDPSFPRFHLPDPIRRAVLSAEPSICSRALQPNDKFVIFASDGLWEHMTNQEAAEIVHKGPRNVCSVVRSYF